MKTTLLYLLATMSSWTGEGYVGKSSNITKDGKKYEIVATCATNANVTITEIDIFGVSDPNFHIHVDYSAPETWDRSQKDWIIYGKDYWDRACKRKPKGWIFEQ